MLSANTAAWMPSTDVLVLDRHRTTGVFYVMYLHYWATYRLNLVTGVYSYSSGVLTLRAIAMPNVTMINRTFFAVVEAYPGRTARNAWPQSGAWCTSSWRCRPSERSLGTDWNIRGCRVRSQARAPLLSAANGWWRTQISDTIPSVLQK